MKRLKQMSSDHIIKMIQFLSEYTSDKIIDKTIDNMDCRYYMKFEIAKWLYNIIQCIDIEHKKQIFDVFKNLSDINIQTISKLISKKVIDSNIVFINTYDYEKIITETLYLLKNIKNLLNECYDIEDEILRRFINENLLNNDILLDHEDLILPENQFLAKEMITSIILNPMYVFKSIQVVFKDVPIIQNYNTKYILWEDTFFNEYLAYDIINKKLCNLKIVILDNSEIFKDFSNKIKKINHPNLITCFDIDIIDHLQQMYYYISTPYISFSTVDEVIKLSNLSYENKIFILKNIALGLSALHQSSIIHNDLKPSNCIITEKFEIKLKNFCLGKYDKSIYMSPELINGEEISFSTDIWSFGVIAIELLSENSNEIHLNISYLLNHLDQSLDENLMKILKKCLDANKNLRFKDGLELTEALSKLSETQNTQTWDKLLNTQVIEKYIYKAINEKKTKIISITDFNDNHPNVIANLYFNKLDALLKNIKNIAMKENWESIMSLDIDQEKENEFKELDFFLKKREADEYIDIKNLISTLSTDEIFDKFEEIAEKKKSIRLKFEAQLHLKRNLIEKKYINQSILKNTIIKKIYKLLYPHQSNMIINEQNIKKDKRVLSCIREKEHIEEVIERIEKIENKEIEVQVLKKGWLRNKTIIEKKIVSEKKIAFEIVNKRMGYLENIHLGIFNMIYCPAGECYVGHQDDEIKIGHKIHITKNFWIGETLVTQELWQAVMGWNPSRFKGTGRLPVENMTWYDCLLFCNKLSELDGFNQCYLLSDIEMNGQHIVKASVEWIHENGYRLATECEWEYSAKAGTEFTIVEANYVDDVAWYIGNAQNKTHEVKKKQANSWGIYDMIGNVSEWCHDAWDLNAYKNLTNTNNPVNWTNKHCKRIVRGGSFMDFLTSSSVSQRYVQDSNYKDESIGFRLFRSDM